MLARKGGVLFLADGLAWRQNKHISVNVEVKAFLKKKNSESLFLCERIQLLLLRLRLKSG